MGKRNYRRFETSFKQRLVEQIEKGYLSATEAAREHQIAKSLIERWRRKCLSNTLVEKPTKRERQLEIENETLKAKIGELVVEMDHLKKWQIWVQQRKSADTSVITAKTLDRFRKPAK